MISIYRKADNLETLVCQVSSKNASHNSAIMGVDEVQISVVVDAILDIKEGDYIKYNNAIYTLNRDAEFTKVSDVQYSYELIFEHPIYTLLDKLFVHRVSGLSNFIQMGKLADFVELLVWCVNKTADNPLGVDTGWGVGTVIDTEFKNIVFADLSCREVLNQLANEFNAEYYVDNKQINFIDRIENATDLVFEQGKGKGLYTVTQRNVDKEDTVTRIYPRGGNKNVPNQYADYEGYLVLPEKYLENFSEHSKVVEKKVTFKEEFPHFKGTVATVAGEDNEIITCPEIDFDISEIAVGTNARINFLTGDLMGVSFEFQWNNSEKKITLIKQEDETALPDQDGNKPQIPNENKKAKVGDTFNFTGLFMPDSYVLASIERLRTKAQSYLEFYSRKRVAFDLEIDHRFMRGKPTLKAGDLITINIPQKELSKLLRITSIERNIETGAINCTVSNYLDEKWEKKIENQIANLSSSINSSVYEAFEGIIDVLQQYDNRVPSDRNVMSSLRTLLEIKNRAISRETNDTAQGLIKFLQGIEVGNFTQGFLGGGGAFKMVDGLSELEVDKLTVRMIATFFELVINKISHIGGQLLLTPARMKCTRVVDGGSYYRCYFDRGENNEVNNEFVAGDLARCQVFSGSGMKTYWRAVTSVGDDYINLSKTDCLSGSAIPEKSDEIVQLGNKTNSDRQNAMILSTVGSDAPSWKQYAGINSYSLEGKETTVFSSKGNKIPTTTVFTGDNTTLDDWMNGTSTSIEELNNMEIDLRNLIKMPFAGYSTSNPYFDFSYDGNYVYWRQKTSNTGPYAFYLYDADDFERYYTFSVKTDAPANVVRNRIYIGTPVYGTVEDKGAYRLLHITFKKQITTLINNQYIIRFYGVNLETGNETYKFWDFCFRRGNKLMGYTPAPEEIESEIAAAQQTADDAVAGVDATNQAVTNLNNYVDGAFADGIISQQEAFTIQNLINVINSEKAGLEATYNKLYMNTYLEGQAKTDLLNAKINYFGATTALLTAINNAIADGQATQQEVTAVNNAYNAYTARLAEFHTAIENANKAIQEKLNALAEEYVDNIQIGGGNLLYGTDFTQGLDGVQSLEGSTLLVDTYGRLVVTRQNSTHRASIVMPITLIAGRNYILGVDEWWRNGGFISTEITATGETFAFEYFKEEDLNFEGGKRKFYKLKPTKNIVGRLWITSNFGGGTTEFRIKRPMLEEATHPSNYNPNYEDISNQLAAAMAEALSATAITNGFTSITGGLIYTFLILLRDINKDYETAGISGVQQLQGGQNLYAPSFWSGGTAAQAANFSNLMQKIDAGTVQSSDWKAKCPTFCVLHNGHAKIGSFIVKNNEEISVWGDSTSERFLIKNSAIADFDAATTGTDGNGETQISARNLSTGTATIGSINVEHGEAKVRFRTSLLRLTNTPPASGIQGASVTLELWKGLGYIGEIAYISVINGTESIEIDKTFTNMASGVYTVKAVYNRETGNTGSAYLATSYLSWSYTAGQTRRTEIGVNGLFSIFSSGWVYFREGFGLDVKGNTNVPGTLLSGTVGASGGVDSWWGIRTISSCACGTPSNATYTVYHYLGHNQYHLSFAPYSSRTYRIVSKQADYFQVQFYSGSSPSITRFDFQMTGDNYTPAGRFGEKT